jgi:N utilization substance protein B
MSTVARSVLRLAVFELVHTDTPPRVVINEAVEITKIYDVAESAAFVNGILNNLARESGFLKDPVSSENDV